MTARFLRFMTELLGTGSFVLVFFGLPLIVMALGASLIQHSEVVETGETRTAVYWQPAGGGDGGADDETVDAIDEPGEEAATDTLPEDVQAAASGKEYSPRGTSGSTTSSTRRGQGTGEGSGNGPVVMYRPEGHDRPRLAQHSGGGSGRSCDPATDRIVAINNTTFQVERTLVEEYGSVKAAKTLVGWVAKHEDDRGKMDGVQVGGIACGSPLHLAGIRSGDVVHDVNGKEITGIFSALAAYKQLKKADVLTVRITRSGRPLAVVYHMS